MVICLGENIRNLRISKGITQEKFGYEMGVSAQAVSRWENGVTYPDITMLPTIADYFDVTLDTLMGRGKELESKEREAFFQKIYEMRDNGQHSEILNAYNQMLHKHPNDVKLLHGKAWFLYSQFKKNGRPRPCQRNHFSLQQDKLHQQSRYAMRRKRSACTRILQIRRTRESKNHRKRITLLRSW